MLPLPIEMKFRCLDEANPSARSLLSRAGVSPDIAERVLAHKIGGVRGVYDRYAYLEEKREALTKLAGLIGEITKWPRL